MSNLQWLGPTTSAKALNRLQILERVLERRLAQAQAARRLGPSLRRVELLCPEFRLEGLRSL